MSFIWHKSAHVRPHYHAAFGSMIVWSNKRSFIWCFMWWEGDRCGWWCDVSCELAHMKYHINTHTLSPVLETSTHPQPPPKPSAFGCGLWGGRLGVGALLVIEGVCRWAQLDVPSLLGAARCAQLYMPVHARSWAHVCGQVGMHVWAACCLHRHVHMSMHMGSCTASSNFYRPKVDNSAVSCGLGILMFAHQIECTFRCAQGDVQTSMSRFGILAYARIMHAHVRVHMCEQLCCLHMGMCTCACICVHFFAELSIWYARDNESFALICLLHIRLRGQHVGGRLGCMGW